MSAGVSMYCTAKIHGQTELRDNSYARVKVERFYYGGGVG